MDYFSHNTSPDMDSLMIWKAHKRMLRCELIRSGAQHKCERETEMKQLTDQIYSLETLHKQSLTIRTAKELLEARKTLQQILEAKAKRLLFFKKQIYYESGDKSGRQDFKGTHLQ